jgi:hypothetical protein
MQGMAEHSAREHTASQPAEKQDVSGAEVASDLSIQQLREQAALLQSKALELEAHVQQLAQEDPTGASDEIAVARQQAARMRDTASQVVSAIDRAPSDKHGNKVMPRGQVSSLCDKVTSGIRAGEHQIMAIDRAQEEAHGSTNIAKKAVAAVAAPVVAVAKRAVEAVLPAVHAAPAAGHGIRAVAQPSAATAFNGWVREAQTTFQRVSQQVSASLSSAVADFQETRVGKALASAGQTVRAAWNDPVGTAKAVGVKVSNMASSAADALGETVEIYIVKPAQAVVAKTHQVYQAAKLEVTSKLAEAKKQATETLAQAKAAADEAMAKAGKALDTAQATVIATAKQTVASAQAAVTQGQKWVVATVTEKKDQLVALLTPKPEAKPEVVAKEATKKAVTAKAQADGAVSLFARARQQAVAAGLSLSLWSVSSPEETAAGGLMQSLPNVIKAAKEWIH